MIHHKKNLEFINEQDFVFMDNFQICIAQILLFIEQKMCLINTFYQRYSIFHQLIIQLLSNGFSIVSLQKRILFCKHLIQVMHHLQRKILPWGLKQFLYSIIQDQLCRKKKTINILYLLNLSFIYLMFLMKESVQYLSHSIL